MLPVMLPSVASLASPLILMRIVIGPLNKASTTAGDKPWLIIERLIDSGVSDSDQRHALPLAISIVHAAIIAIRIGELAHQFPISWQRL